MSKHRVKNGRAIEKHHTIGLMTIDEIDWHLKNLWCAGWKSIVDMPTSEHKKHTGEKQKLAQGGLTKDKLFSKTKYPGSMRQIGNERYWIPAKQERE